MSDLTLIPGRYAAVNTAADVAVNTNLGLYIGTGGEYCRCWPRWRIDDVLRCSMRSTLSAVCHRRSAANGTTATGIVALYPEGERCLARS